MNLGTGRGRSWSQSPLVFDNKRVLGDNLIEFIAGEGFCIAQELPVHLQGISERSRRNESVRVEMVYRFAHVPGKCVRWFAGVRGDRELRFSFRVAMKNPRQIHDEGIQPRVSVLATFSAVLKLGATFKSGDAVPYGRRECFLVEHQCVDFVRLRNQEMGPEIFGWSESGFLTIIQLNLQLAKFTKQFGGTRWWWSTEDLGGLAGFLVEPKSH